MSKREEDTTETFVTLAQTGMSSTITLSIKVYCPLYAHGLGGKNGVLNAILIFVGEVISVKLITISLWVVLLIVS